MSGIERFLQRIQPGVPVRLEVSGGRAALRMLSDPSRVWTSWEVEPDSARGVYDGVLEVFAESHRWSEAAILQSEPAEWRTRRDLSPRLVLNHDGEGSPIFEPGWRMAGMKAAVRPTLPGGPGEEWSAALAVPCESIRVYTRDESGRWSHWTASMQRAPGGAAAARTLTIPVERSARPWSPRPMRVTRDGDFPSGFQIQSPSSRKQEA